MLAKFSIFFSALGFIFSFLVYTNAFLNPEIVCVLGAQNCIEIVGKSIFRNFALFLTAGFFLSFLTNFAKFFASKDGHKIAVITNLIVILLTFLIAGVLMIMAVTSTAEKGTVSILSVLVWAWTFVNIVVALLEMKPEAIQSYTEGQTNHIFAFSVMLFLLLSSVGSLVFSNSFIQKKNAAVLEELRSGGISQKSSPAGVDLSPLILGLDRIREELRAGTTTIDYGKIETSVKNGLLAAFNELQGRRGREEEEKPKEFSDLSVFEIENDYFLGSRDAPVTIVEFASFTCPYCINLHPVMMDVVKKYGDKIRYVYKYFPVHGEIDVKLAELVEAAGAQGKYHEFFDKLNRIETIRSVISDYEKGELNKQKVLEIAKEVGLDTGKFEEAIDKRTFQAKVTAHENVGRKIGVGGTPTIFINGKEYRGGRTVEAFSKIIDEELQKVQK